MQFIFPKQPVTKTEILDKVSQESLFCYYLNIPRITKKLIVNPLRQDHKPTAGFYKSSNGWVFMKDFGNGKTYNCFTIVMEKYNCDFRTCLEIIAKDFGIRENCVPTRMQQLLNVPKIEEKKKTQIRVQIQEFTEDDLKYWNSYGITKTTLEYFKIFSCKAVWLNNSIFSINENKLIYGYFGGFDEGRELWRIYYPQNKGTNALRFLGNWPSDKIQGWEQLPKNGKIVIITKSLKDVALLHEYKIPACAPCSETIKIDKAIIDELRNRFKHVVVLGDNDKPGIDAMFKMKKEYPELIYTWFPRSLGKDATDVYKDKGENALLKQISIFLNWLKLKK